MIAKADELISSLAMRKNGVTSLLEGMAMHDWGEIRNHSLCPDESGIIPTNTVFGLEHPVARSEASPAAVQRGPGGHQDQGHSHPLRPQ